jgi:hypothetical protein
VAEWHEVSVLSYDAFSGSNRVKFADYADADPAESSLWGYWAKMDADMIWRGYKQCKGRVMAQMKDGPKKAQATVAFRQGSRGISETKIRKEGSRFGFRTRVAKTSAYLVLGISCKCVGRRRSIFCT